MAGEKEYHVALFRMCSDEPSFFETFIKASEPEEAMEKAMDKALEENKVPKDMLERDEPIFVCVSDDEDEYHYIAYPYEGGGYEWKEYEPLFDLRECNEEQDED